MELLRQRRQMLRVRMDPTPEDMKWLLQKVGAAVRVLRCRRKRMRKRRTTLRHHVKVMQSLVEKATERGVTTKMKQQIGTQRPMKQAKKLRMKPAVQWLLRMRVKAAQPQSLMKNSGPVFNCHNN